MKRRLIQFYDSFGDRGVMFILYALAVVANSLPAVFSDLPVIFPDEAEAAGIAAFYSGKDWSGLLEQLNGGSGYVQALLYAPLFWVIKNPYALYKAMLIVNAFLIGFIPLIAYHLAGKFGVMRVRRKLLIAFCCGLYAAYTINSKFIWNEPLTCLLSWLMVLCLFSAWDKSSRSSRFALSVYVGFLCAFAYAANKRLIAPVAALVLTAVIARLVMREKTLNLPVFGITLAASFITEHFLRRSIEQSLWGEESSAKFLDISVNAGNGDRFLSALFSHIYAFMTSSVGMGALAAAIFAVMIFSYLSEGIKDRPKTLEDGTKIYEPIKHKYSTRLTVFALFQFLAVGCTAVASSLFTFDTGKYAQETAVFGRYTDSIAPFAIFLVLVYVFLYGIDLAKPLIGAGIYGYSCICFAVAGYPLAQFSNRFMYSLLFGSFPMTAGEGDAESSGINCLVMSSIVFTLYALIIIFVSCTRKKRAAFVTGTVFGVLMAITVYSTVFCLPNIYRQNSEKQAPWKEIMSLIYNDAQSPPVVVYDTDPQIAATLQFLASETHVVLLNRGGHVPESCLLIAKSGVQAPFEGGSYDIVGRTSEFTVYAYGDNARDFIRYSSSKDTSTGSTSAASSAANPGRFM
ncbi:MAG: hypothetical protein K2J80_05770 [Oscillospiraceae bacterium]|nr:hypothetical protein [Oscillospiraceae bacterium]